MLKKVLILLSLTFVFAVGKTYIGKHNSSKKSVEGVLAEVIEKINESLPLTLMFDERQGLRINSVEYLENAVLSHATGIGHFESGETNRNRLENYVLETYCGASFARIRENNIKWEYDIVNEVRGLNDSPTHTKISFSPSQCKNFQLSKELNKR